MNGIERLFKRLYEHFGPQYWWPAESKFEVMIGTILTQNVNWKNVETAISKLKKERIMTPEKILKTDDYILHGYLRSTGFYRQKSARLKEISRKILEEGSVEDFLDADELRTRLLGIKGIGPETADSIALYAGDIPIFVVDAYTKRILERCYGIQGSYEYIQDIFHKNLPEDLHKYQEYHALLVKLAKKHCKVKPICQGCPIALDCGFTTQKATS